MQKFLALSLSDAEFLMTNPLCCEEKKQNTNSLTTEIILLKKGNQAPRV